jgi:hypothetical protein
LLRQREKYHVLTWVYPASFQFLPVHYSLLIARSFTAIYLPIYGSTALVDLGPFFSFLIYTQSVGLLGRGISPPQGLYLHTEQHKHRINEQTSMPVVGFEPTIPVSEQAKTVHALDRAVTVIGTGRHKQRINAERHPCPEWNSNPRSQCSSGRRCFMP